MMEDKDLNVNPEENEDEEKEEKEDTKRYVKIGGTKRKNKDKVDEPKAPKEVKVEEENKVDEVGEEEAPSETENNTEEVENKEVEAKEETPVEEPAQAEEEPKEEAKAEEQPVEEPAQEERVGENWDEDDEEGAIFVSEEELKRKQEEAKRQEEEAKRLAEEAERLATLKEEAKANVDETLDNVVRKQYTDDNYDLIVILAQEAKTNIDNAKNEAELNEALANFNTALSEVPQIPKLQPKEKYVDIYPRPERRMPPLEGLNVAFYGEGVGPHPKTGQPIYPGDDGLPFVNDNILMVTDGLGGASCIRHTKFNRGLFEEELVYDTLFKDLYGEREDNELLDKYAVDSFASLISIRNLYDRDDFDDPKSILYIKKSGHFGSRIAAAVLVHHFLQEETVNEFNGVFDKIHELEAQNKLEEKEQLIKDTAAKLERQFKAEFVQVANNGSFFNESRSPKLDVLGTTLCLTFFRENKEEKYVEALYFLAGDSLPFMMNENGLYEVMDAHENPDGTISNRIRSNDIDAIEFMKSLGRTVKEYYFEPKYVRIPTPCVLFNASDGVFDCFTTPLFMEKVFVDMMAEAKSAEELSNNFANFFAENCHIDDSSTSAMKFFGFDNYEQVREFALKRKQKIEEEYLKEENGGLPELFNADYTVLLNNRLSQHVNNVNKVQSFLKNNPRVTEFYEARYQKRLRSIDRIKANIAFLEGAIAQTNSELEYHQNKINITGGDKDPQLAELARFDDAVEQALVNEIGAFVRYKEKSEEKLYSYQNDLGFYKSFDDEWAVRGIRTVETLISYRVFTKEEIDELLLKYNVSLDDKPDPETEKLQRLAKKQRELFHRYEEVYNSFKTK